jgi:hypothetical protein
MKRKLAIIGGMFLLLALTTIIFVSTNAGRSGSAQKTPNLLVVTQDGKLTVLSPASYANFKLVVDTKSLTNTAAAATNSERR